MSKISATAIGAALVAAIFTTACDEKKDEATKVPEKTEAKADEKKPEAKVEEKKPEAKNEGTVEAKEAKDGASEDAQAKKQDGKAKKKAGKEGSCGEGTCGDKKK
jgi:translation initiation factor IF-2